MTKCENNVFLVAPFFICAILYVGSKSTQDSVSFGVNSLDKLGGGSGIATLSPVGVGVQSMPPRMNNTNKVRTDVLLIKNLSF